jgi:hypothetical protein
MGKLVTTFFCLSFLCFCPKGQAQAWVDTNKVIGNPEQLNWNDINLITVPTTKTVDKHLTEFAILHRFGDMGGQAGGGVHTLYGFDVASDIYFYFSYGLFKNLQLTIGRSKQQELIDGSIKYRPLTQKDDGSPLSIAILGDFAVIPEATNAFYGPGDMSQQNFYDRFVYLYQAVISKRFDKHISVELIPTMDFRNHVIIAINPNNNTYDENIIPAIGAGARYMFNHVVGIVADYYYVISNYRTNNPVQSYYNPFSIGVEMHTGGHVFEINLSNASAISPVNIIPYTTDKWRNGGFKLGFSISRLF